MSVQQRIHPISHDQNYLQLASILSTSLGLPAIILGRQLAVQYGAGSAILSILVGNLILWLIGIAIISMSDKGRINAIENAKNYIGKYGSLLMTLVLIFSFINWYVIQINSTVSAFNDVFHISSAQQKVGIGLGISLGVITSLLAIFGIQFIKKICTVSLPILFFYHIYGILASNSSISLRGTWGISFPAVVFTILIILPGIVNLPTFFRHSRSRANSFFALSLMMFFISFFEISTIWMNLDVFEKIAFKTSLSILHLILSMIFILILLICSNLVNIYFASACWETFTTKFKGPREYAIIGLVGTAAYVFIEASQPVLFIENVTNSFIGTLGIILLIAFLIKLVVQHRPRAFEKFINFASWMIGCLTVTIVAFGGFQDEIHLLLAGIGMSVLFYLCVIFVEESLWATKKLIQK